MRRARRHSLRALDDHGARMTRGWATLLAVAVVGAACSSGSRRADPPVLVPWHKIGDIGLGNPQKRVVREYGKEPEFGYRRHGSRVYVEFAEGRVSAIRFSTPYYRTKSGFGVGSRIPLGPCHRTMSYPCLHLWNGFMWNLTLREKPCSCWVKVGRGPRSLPATGRNFLKPWFFIDVHRGRVSGFYVAL